MKIFEHRDPEGDRLQIFRTEADTLIVRIPGSNGMCARAVELDPADFEKMVRTVWVATSPDSR